MGSALGVAKAAARRLGMTYEEYTAKVASGQKWCGACRHWQPRSSFGSDRSRYDGLTAICLDSRSAKVEGRPTLRQRRISAAFGLAWCRGCRDWVPADDVASGVCREHRNEAARHYYSSNRIVQCSRKNGRTRGLDPIPTWWQEEKLADFGGRCAYGCGKKATTFDHVFPVARGGKSRPSNLVPACRPCNSSKRANPPWPWIEEGLGAFPWQWEALIALDLETAGVLDAEEAGLYG